MRIQEEEENLYDYSEPVYTSLVQPIRFMGIGETAAMIILCITAILMIAISKFCVAFGFIAFFIVKRICKDEPFMIDFIVEQMNQNDYYRG